MKTLLAVSLVFLFATTATAQFAGRATQKGKAAEAAPAKAAEKPAEQPALPVEPAAGADAGAPNGLFAALDLDGDGVISKVELKKAIVSLKKLDTDNDGNLTLAECGGGAAAAGGPAVAGNDQTQWIEQIMANDKNKDGKLAPNELNENEKQMLQFADQNNDGFIDRQELAAFANNQNALNGAVGAFNAAGARGGAGRGGNEAMGLFFKYDRNHDGRLTTDEVPPQAVNSLKVADINQDGVIDASEFHAMAARMGDRMKAWAAGPNVAGNATGSAGENDARNRKRARN
jgi:Ca2+-binding EF-hand superfamily protein